MNRVTKDDLLTYGQKELVQESEILPLKISSLLDVNVPLGCTHLIVMVPANGKVRLIAVEASTLSSDALAELSKHGITVPINQ